MENELPLLVFNPQDPVLVRNSISPDSLRNRQALTRPHIKLPTVQRTFDDVPADYTVRQWCTLVRTKVFDGIIFATNIENSYFVAIGKFHSSAFAR